MAEGSAVPTFAIDAEIDVSALTEFRAEQHGKDEAPSLNDYVVRAVALALGDFPRLNGSFTERGFELYSRVNVGIAVAAEGALLVPVVFDAETKSVLEISVESRRLAGLARTHDIAPADLDGGTFTVTNLGMFGTSRFLPIVNPPQSAILAVGAATRRPEFDEDGNVVPREILTATLVCDHRIVYGAEGARFLARLRELLEDPGQL
jgi:pyruvate dehydrogenase E2 component (dihydrolipoamide acetyltransferase)